MKQRMEKNKTGSFAQGTSGFIV